MQQDYDGIYPAESDFQSVLGDPDPDYLAELELDEDSLAHRKYQATNNDPVGSILIKLLGECADQASKNNKTMSFGVDQLCNLFYNHKIHEKQKLKQKMQQHAASWEEEMIERELNSHTLNQTVEPPSNFSAVPTLESNKQLADVMRLLPSGANKFSGAPGKMSVLEYLFSLNMMQKQCFLSKPEFLQMMLASTTGKPHIYLMRRIQERDDLSNMYHNLLLHYDKRMEPEEARVKLHSYKAPKSANLAEVEVHIQELAGLTTSALPEGTARNTAYNYEQVQALIKCLPPQSSIMVRNLYNQLSTRLKKPAQAGQLSRLLNNYRYTIDQDIKAHGGGSGEDKRYPSSRFNSNQKAAGKFPRKFSSYSISQGGAPPITNVTTNNWQSRPRPMNGQSRQPTPGQYTRPSANFVRTGPPRTGNFRPRTAGFGNKGSNRGRFSRPSFPRGSGNGTYCSLCGKKDHRAVDGCKYMVTDSGRVVKVMPTKDTCTACPSYISPPLSHPVHLCPFRPSGPLHKK